jgi:hypothetical protein
MRQPQLCSMPPSPCRPVVSPREEFLVPCCYIEKAAGMNQRSFLAGKSIIQGNGSIDGTGQDDRPPRR